MLVRVDVEDFFRVAASRADVGAETLKASISASSVATATGTQATPAPAVESGTQTGGLPGVDQPVVAGGLLVLLLASVGFVAWRKFVRH